MGKCKILHYKDAASDGAGGREGQRGGRGGGQIERAGSAGRQRGAAGECELRGEEQFPPGLPGVRAGRVGEVQGAGAEGAKLEPALTSPQPSPLPPRERRGRRVTARREPRPTRSK